MMYVNGSSSMGLPNFLEISNYNKEEFLKAVNNGNYRIIELILKNQLVDPAFENNMAIRLASAKGHYKVVEILLNDARVNPAACNGEALRAARINGHVRVIELLEEYCLDTRTTKKRKIEHLF